MLYDVLQALEHAPGPISLEQLSKQLGVERAVLEDMISFWVRKGRLRDSSMMGKHACPTGGCHGCSPHEEGCIFDQAGPRTITLIPKP